MPWRHVSIPTIRVRFRLRAKAGSDDVFHHQRCLPHLEKSHRPRRVPSESSGIDADAPEHTSFAPEFLMQQMEWRETLENIENNKDSDELTAFTKDIERTRRAILDELSHRT